MNVEGIRDYEFIVLKPLVNMVFAGKEYVPGEPLLVFDGRTGNIGISIETENNEAKSDIALIDWTKINGASVIIGAGTIDEKIISMLSMAKGLKQTSLKMPIYGYYETNENAEIVFSHDVLAEDLFVYNTLGEKITASAVNNKIITTTANQEVLVSCYGVEDSGGMRYEVTSDTIQGYFKMECKTSVYGDNKNKRNLLITFPKVSLQNSFRLLLGKQVPLNLVSLQLKALPVKIDGKNKFFSIDYFD